MNWLRQREEVQCSPRRRWLAGLLSLVLCCCLGSAQAASRLAQWAGTVTHVTDGDTVWVQPEHGGVPRKIRIDGIDAPEICQTYGNVARDVLSERVQGRRVQVRGRRTDDYGRLLARISLQGEDVGHWLVLQGHAWSYRRSRHDAGPYAAQEAQARAQHLGLWQGRAVPPRTFRRRHGSCH